MYRKQAKVKVCGRIVWLELAGRSYMLPLKTGNIIINDLARKYLSKQKRSEIILRASHDVLTGEVSYFDGIAGALYEIAREVFEESDEDED